MRRTRTALFSAIVAATFWSLTPIATQRLQAQDHDHDHAQADQHDQHEADAHTHPEAAALKNPVPSSPASIAAGQKIFQANCVSCHGPAGAGDGKNIAQMNPKPSNLTDADWKHGSTDGEIFTLIRDGSKNTAMKGFASKMTTNDLWNVVNFIRTLNTSSTR
jgi:putative ABC transport system permease protein